ncbi:hypothetical protein HK096_004769, partial [Nowakowskiella sp. JEL0078]
ENLLLGTDEGLFVFDTSASDPKMTPLSNRKYVQLDAIEELGLVVSRSGKYDVVATQDITAMTKFRANRRTKFETETKLKKMKETKGCSSFTISKMKESVYLCVAMPRSVLIMKWAAHPLNRFMKFKDVSFENPPRSLDLVELPTGDLKLYLSTPSRYKCVDLQSMTIEEIVVPGMDDEKAGIPLQCIAFDDRIVICYTNVGLVTDLEGLASDTKQFKWRNSLAFTGKLGEDYLAAGTRTAVDIVNHETGKIVHVFETSKSRIRELSFLLSKSNKLFLLAEEERDSMKTSSIITIQLDFAQSAADR